jgi:GT2 family glycosyltransferase
VNFGADHATGKYLILLNNDTEVISPEWIEAMLGFCCQGEIGAVGAKLLFPNDRIQHAGVVLGLGGPAGHPLHSFPRRTPHAFGIAEDIRNYSAVTAACMMVRKNVFQQVGGFNEDLAAAYNDVDFCLKLREAGYRIVWTPSAELYHHESASRGYSLDPKEVAYFQERWGHMLNDDPYYNPNLTRRHAHFGPRT